ncbi:DUF3073 domain-containing protein [Tessaracoccus antarcticus]|uniref:DUF3073 domain-containing protein n=1 Tax=Tessaracoccus antarcticus TaxID=2479848 RepID=A0A3M0G259_9ACTN|nr:DUF3073 domain-containing protein [Tessaracoccus antarcticus]RMB58207.1 DUF3073 domain-containing protein [Tessaracoccus antarcticus]
MGRGRAKAKQTKVARDLKYRPMDTDFASLERELRGGSYSGPPESEGIPEEYADLAEEYGASVKRHDDEVHDSRL